MPIEFSCNSCGQLVRTPDSAAGKKGKCPHCGTIAQIPLASPIAPAPAARQGTENRGQGRVGNAATGSGAVISFLCESCGQTVRTPMSAAGKKGKCPHCQSVVQIPGGTAPAAAQAPARPAAKPSKPAAAAPTASAGLTPLAPLPSQQSKAPTANPGQSAAWKGTPGAKRPAAPVVEELEELPTLSPIDSGGLTPLGPATGGLAPLAPSGGLAPLGPASQQPRPLGDDLFSALPALSGPALPSSPLPASPMGMSGGYGANPLGAPAPYQGSPYQANPYQSGPYPGGPQHPRAPARQGPPIGVLLPAIAMLLSAVVSLLIWVAFTVPAVFNDQPGRVPEGIDPQTWALLVRILPIVFLAIAALWYGAIIFGAVQMIRLRNLSAAKTAAVLSIFPCSIWGFCFGLAIGIWALVVLYQTPTQRLFRD